MDWFSRRRESLVMKQLRRHALKVYDTVSDLDEAMKSMCMEKGTEAKEAIRRILISEKEADNLERTISEELSKGDLDSRQREDMLHLIRRMDYTADWAKEAAMNLNLIVEARVDIPVSLWRHYCNMTAGLKRAVYHLHQAVENLGKDREEVLLNWEKVEELEHELDEQYFRTKKEILLADMDPRAIFLMRDLLHGIENSADSCKDAADTIHIFITAELYHR